MTAAKLRSVPTTTAEQSPPDMSYEARERRHIMSRNWAAMHVAADRREPVFLRDVRTVRRG